MKTASAMLAPRSLPLFGVAGLEDDGLALGGALEVERAYNGEKLALVVERMLFGAVEEDAALFVAREGVGFVGVPEALRYLHVLQTSAVARRIVVVLVTAVVACGT